MSGAHNFFGKKKINIPDEARCIIDVLYKNNFEAYVVGGCVRDCLLEKNPKDWDITTNAKPNEIKEIFNDTAKIIETGIAHGTLTIILNKKKFEITTYRTDGIYSDYRRPDKVDFVSDLKEDLSRRDFCMNAIAYNDRDGLVDLFGGLENINEKKIRCVGDPEKRFSEDALRMLRALRFANQLDFYIDDISYSVLKKKIEIIKFISIERVHDELVKLFLALNINKIYLLKESGILKFINHDFYVYFDKNFDGIKKNLARVKLFSFDKNIDIILVAILYKMRSENAYELLRFFKFDNKTCNKIRIILSCLYKKIVADKYLIKKLIAYMGIENFYELLVLKKIIGYKNTECVKILANEILIAHECIFLKDLKINGDDIKKLGFSGKNIGRVLNYLLDIVNDLPEKNLYDTLVYEVNKLRKKFLIALVAQG